MTKDSPRYLITLRSPMEQHKYNLDAYDGSIVPLSTILSTNVDVVPHASAHKMVYGQNQGVFVEVPCKVFPYTDYDHTSLRMGEYFKDIPDSQFYLMADEKHETPYSDVYGNPVVNLMDKQVRDGYVKMLKARVLDNLCVTGIILDRLSDTLYDFYFAQGKAIKKIEGWREAMVELIEQIRSIRPDILVLGGGHSTKYDYLLNGIYYPSFPNYPDPESGMPWYFMTFNDRHGLTRSEIKHREPVCNILQVVVDKDMQDRDAVRKVLDYACISSLLNNAFITVGYIDEAKNYGVKFSEFIPKGKMHPVSDVYTVKGHYAKTWIGRWFNSKSLPIVSRTLMDNKSEIFVVFMNVWKHALYFRGAKIKPYTGVLYRLSTLNKVGFFQKEAHIG